MSGWVKKHRTILTKIIDDERLNPNRRLLAELLALWLDSETPEQKDRVFKIIEAQYGTPKRTFWLEGDDPNLKPSLGVIEQQATEALKDFFAKAKEDTEDIRDEISAEKLHPSGE